MTPSTGQVYRTASGAPALYVRTEKRNGHPAEHLFVCTRDRVVFEWWASEVPPDFELIHSPPADRELLLSLLTEACQLLPATDAVRLRMRWTTESKS